MHTNYHIKEFLWVCTSIYTRDRSTSTFTFEYPQFKKETQVETVYLKFEKKGIELDIYILNHILIFKKSFFIQMTNLCEIDFHQTIQAQDIDDNSKEYVLLVPKKTKSSSY